MKNLIITCKHVDRSINLMEPVFEDLTPQYIFFNY